MSKFESHTIKKRRARIFLILVFVLTCVANGLFLRFSFDVLNPIPLLRGLAIGGTLWTTVLLIGMWRRQGWARYVLITLMVLTVLGFGLALISVNDGTRPASASLSNLVLGGIALYVLAMIPLGGSRSVRLLMSPQTAGGH